MTPCIMIITTRTYRLAVIAPRAGDQRISSVLYFRHHLIPSWQPAAPRQNPRGPSGLQLQKREVRREGVYGADKRQVLVSGGEGPHELVQAYFIC